MKTFGARSPERRRTKYLAVLAVLTWAAVLVYWYRTTRQLPPPPNNLTHFAASRMLQEYVKPNTQPILEPPPGAVCPHSSPVVALVPSAPARLRQRAVIRATWAYTVETYFFMGLVSGLDRGRQMQMYIKELKSHGDVVVYNFVDSYSNLTLKTALMLQWAEARCPGVAFVMKVDDDVLVNPWTLGQVLEERHNADIIGWTVFNKMPIRDPTEKWYLPTWLYGKDLIPEYILGPTYMIKADKLRLINRAAYRVPLINIEDVYFTYLVAKRALGLNLTHEPRFSCRRPVLHLGCNFWRFATVHSMPPESTLHIWPVLVRMGGEFLEGREMCRLYWKYFYFLGEGLFTVLS